MQMAWKLKSKEPKWFLKNGFCYYMWKSEGLDTLEQGLSTLGAKLHHFLSETIVLEVGLHQWTEQTNIPVFPELLGGVAVQGETR